MTTADRVNAIVPVNVPSKSKLRLSSRLSVKERAKLTVAMLGDVLTTLRKSSKVNHVTVVSADKLIREIARKCRASFIWEGKRRGLNKALRLAIARARRQQAAGILVIHSDLPYLKARDVDRLIRISSAFSVTLVPSRDGKGTNAMVMRPPGVVRPAFGKDSLRRHRLMARRKRLKVRVIKIRRMGMDIDRSIDLSIAMRSSLKNRTGQFLKCIRA